MSGIKVIACMLCFGLSACSAQGQKRRASSSDDGVLIALEVARRDFRGRIERPRDGNQELARYLSQIANYETTFYEANGTVVVEIAPLPAKDGHTFRGGAARYVVDPQTRKILSFESIR